MDTFVIDASIGVKWFFEEKGREAAFYLFDRLERGEIKVAVPEFFYAEMGNVCRSRVRKKEIKSSVAFQIMDRVMELSLQSYSDQELSDVAFDNAIQFDLTVYDALYVSLAEIYTAPLVTADDLLIKACKDRFDFIMPLQEIKTPKT